MRITRIPGLCRYAPPDDGSVVLDTLGCGKQFTKAKLDVTRESMIKVQYKMLGCPVFILMHIP